MEDKSHWFIDAEHELRVFENTRHLYSKVTEMFDIEDDDFLRHQREILEYCGHVEKSVGLPLDDVAKIMRGTGLRWQDLARKSDEELVQLKLKYA